jgi:tartrate-resistant acid phosphatase type 5
MGEVGAAINSAFVISTGDNFYRHGVDSVDDPQWRATFEDVYAAPSLQTPWYAVLGNHDYEGSPAAEVAYTQHSTRWRMPSRYWRQEIGAASFFFIDTTPITRLDEPGASMPFVGDGAAARAQLDWLDRELATCTSPWKIVIGHHPILSSGRHGAAAMMVRHVRPLLERHGVQAYFNGHDHDLEHLVDGRVSYVCSGSGAEARDVTALPQSRFAYPHLGFVSCALSDASLIARFHAEDGGIIYEATIAPA